MTTLVSGPLSSCGYRTGGSYNCSARIDHARCAVKKIVEQFSGTVDFGIAQYATRTTNSSAACYQSWRIACYPQEVSISGACRYWGARLYLGSEGAIGVR